MAKPKAPASGLLDALAGLSSTSDLLAQHAKAPTASSATDRPERIALDLIHPDPEQPRKRFDPVKHEELADSIKAQGVIQAITVRPHPELPGEWMIIAGERRWRASKAVGLLDIPYTVDLRPVRTIKLAQIAENLQRADLTPMEYAANFKSVMDEHGFKQYELAQALGKSKQFVGEYLSLLDMDPLFQAAVEDGRVGGVTVAATLWRLHKQHPQVVVTALMECSPDSPITLAKARALGSAVQTPAATQSPATANGSETGSGVAPSPAADTRPPEVGNGTGTPAASPSPSQPATGQPATADDAVTGDGKSAQGGASANNVYTLTCAAKHGEWTATVRRGAERLHSSPTFPDEATAVASAATWLAGHLSPSSE